MKKITILCFASLMIFSMLLIDAGNIAVGQTTASTDVPRNESLWMAGYWNNGKSSMNPFIGPGNDYSGVFFMYLPLFDTNSQVYSDYLSPSNLIPLLGSDASWNADGSKLTVNLRSQAKWSDGSSVNSTDVVFSLKVYSGLATAAEYNSTGIFQGDLGHQIDSITAPSATQVVITLKSGYYHSEAVYEDLLIGGAPIVPMRVFQGKDNNYDNNWFTNSAITDAMKIVDGPYKPYAMTSDGQTAINVRIDNWWMAGLTDSHNQITWREPDVKYIVSYGTPSNFEQDTALANGQIDLFGSYVANVGSLINGSTKLHAWFEGSNVTQNYPLTSAMNEVVFNYNYYPLDQTWFHKALASAINYNDISQTAASGYLQQASATWLDSNQPAMKAYYNATIAQQWAITASAAQAKSYMEQGAYLKNGAWYTNDAPVGKLYAFTNQTIVSTAGVNTATQVGDMDPNHSGINLLIGGKDQNWNVYCVDGWTDHMASLNIISQNWKSVLNVTIAYGTVDYGTMITNRGVVNPDGTITRAYEMYYSSLGNKLDASPINFFQYFTGTTDQSRNVTGWNNPSFSGNLTAYSTSTDAAAQKTYIDNLQYLLGEYMPSIPVAVNCYWYVYSDVNWVGWPNGHNEVAGKYTGSGEYASRSDYVPVTTHWTTDHFGHDLMIINNLVPGAGSGSTPWDLPSIVFALTSFAVASVVIRKKTKKT